MSEKENDHMSSLTYKDYVDVVEDSDHEWAIEPYATQGDENESTEERQMGPEEEAHVNRFDQENRDEGEGRVKKVGGV